MCEHKQHGQAAGQCEQYLQVAQASSGVSANVMVGRVLAPVVRLHGGHLWQSTTHQFQFYQSRTASRSQPSPGVRRIAASS